jgi:hypothetical protein
MNNLQKSGAVAAFVQAATYLIGIVIAFTVLAPSWDLEPKQYVAFLVDNQTFMHLWHLVIYIVNALFLVVLVLSLNERLKSTSPTMMQVATAIGLIWAGLVLASGMLIINDLGVVAELYGRNPSQAADVWLTLSTIEDGLGGAVELPGGLWILLVTLAALRSNNLPRLLNYLGVIVGGAGLLTAVPTLSDLGAIFGIGSIFWFLWLGICMFRSQTATAFQPSDPIISLNVSTAE